MDFARKTWLFYKNVVILHRLLGLFCQFLYEW